MANTKNSKKTSFIDAAMERVVEFNKFAVQTADQVVEMGIKRAGQWQEVADKAVKGGLKISAKQQDLVFDALESAKSQVMNGKKKVAKLAK